MATSNLDWHIQQALQRKEEREEATRQEERRRRMEAQTQMIACLDREMSRAIQPDILTALDGRFEVQDVYPQCYYLFTVRRVVLHLWYAEQRNAREWNLSRSGTKGERNTIGRMVPEQSYASKEEFWDSLLCAIAELTSDVCDPEGTPF